MVREKKNKYKSLVILENDSTFKMSSIISPYQLVNSFLISLISNIFFKCLKLFTFKSGKAECFAFCEVVIMSCENYYTLCDEHSIPQCNVESKNLSWRCP